MSDDPSTSQTSFRYYLAAGISGLLAGVVGASFHWVLDRAEHWRTSSTELLEGIGVGELAAWPILMAVGAALLTAAAWLVGRFAPEAAGSGVQEIEAILAGERGLRWRRVLPVKFFGGALAVGSGLVLGREGPTVHMGGALAQMSAERVGLDARRQRSLVAAGAAAGLAAAFNAPLAAIVFVTEELRDNFEYGFASIQAVILASCTAVAVSSWLLGQGPDLPVLAVQAAPIWALPLFLVLGVGIGVLGALFNGMLLGSVRSFRALRARYGLAPAAVAGLALGTLVWLAPQSVGGGESLVESLLAQPPTLLALALLLVVRLLTTVGSYGIGLPGGIFAPLLALGTIAGASFDALAQGLDPGSALGPGVFAVAAMGALFAATVRAPLTGTILAIELTGALDLVLPTVLTCLAATFSAEALGGRPIYSLLLAESGRPAVPSAPARGPALRIGVALCALSVLLAAPVWRTPDQASPTTGPAASSADNASGSPALAGQKPPDRTLATAAGRSEPLAPASLPTSEAFPSSAGTEPGAIRQSEAPAGQPAVAPPSPTPESAPSAEAPRYAIQLASSRDLASLIRYARREGLEDRARIAERRRGWHSLLLGRYETPAEAEAALAQLPPELTRHNPFVRELPSGATPVPTQ